MNPGLLPPVQHSCPLPPCAPSVCRCMLHSDGRGGGGSPRSSPEGMWVGEAGPLRWPCQSLLPTPKRPSSEQRLNLPKFIQTEVPSSPWDSSNPNYQARIQTAGGFSSSCIWLSLEWVIIGAWRVPNILPSCKVLTGGKSGLRRHLFGNKVHPSHGHPLPGQRPLQPALAPIRLPGELKADICLRGRRKPTLRMLLGISIINP